ncbi:hypothetical protein NL676_005709 [Syzygium grande]|nr:hypothetical protein NL676_005709 [Syzygium grande]
MGQWGRGERKGTMSFSFETSHQDERVYIEHVLFFFILLNESFLIDDDILDCDARADEEGEGDHRVLDVVEMVQRDGAVRVEGLVTSRADEELHRHGYPAASHDREELQVPKSRGGKPWGDL